MSLKNLLKAELISKFENAKIEGASSLSPRNGYYFIMGVDYKNIPRKGLTPLATVLWKPTFNEHFIKDVTFTIALSSLQLPQPLDYVNCTNTIIQIDNAKLTTAASLPLAKRFECTYTTITEKPTFTTFQEQVLLSFWGNAVTVIDAYNNFEKQLGIDLTDAIQQEAALLEAYDEPANEDDFTELD